MRYVVVWEGCSHWRRAWWIYEPCFSTVWLSHTLRVSIWLLFKNHVTCLYTGRGSVPLCVNVSGRKQVCVSGCLKVPPSGPWPGRETHALPRSEITQCLLGVPRASQETGRLHGQSAHALWQTPPQEAGAPAPHLLAVRGCHPRHHVITQSAQHFLFQGSCF